MIYRLITISGLACSGTSTLTQNLSHHLTWPFASVVSDAVRAYLREHDLPLDAVSTVPDQLHLELDDKVKRMLKIERAKIFTGRTTGLLAQGLDDICKIFVQAGDEERAKRYALREKIPFTDAQIALLKRDKSDFARYERLYHIDPRDHKLYDVVIDTTSISPEQALYQALTALQNQL